MIDETQLAYSCTELPFPVIGISQCLLGDPVRYDGQSKKNLIIQQQLLPFCRIEKICPEVAAGLGTPRPPVQLIQTDKQRAIGVNNKNIDVTQTLLNASQDIAQSFNNHIHGFIFKARSPSCGYGSTPIFNHKKEMIKTGNGIFADTVHKIMGTIPCIEETQLQSEQSCLQFWLAVRRFQESKQANHQLKNH